MDDKSGVKDRREALLDAAAIVFFEQGYAAASIDAIIERAGGSKRNIYSAFGNKEGLFAAIVRRNADSAIATLPIDGLGELSLRETLTVFGRHLMAVYMSPSVIGVYRIAVTEAHRFPDLVRSFYEEGPGRMAARLAEVLEASKQQGDVRIDDCRVAASQFVGMIRDNLHLQVVLGLRGFLTTDEANAAVASAVDIFLNGVRSGRRR
jgi:AcrR family transcriptional regulator